MENHNNVTSVYCTVCGFYLGVPGWFFDVEYGNQYHANYDVICPSCGTQFGAEDWAETKEEVMKNHRKLRKLWIEENMQWQSKTEQSPPNWNPLEQLKNIPKELLGPDENY